MIEFLLGYIIGGIVGIIFMCMIKGGDDD